MPKKNKDWSKYLVLDLETNNEVKYKRVANPWYNDIVAVGLADQYGEYSKYVYPNRFVELKLENIDILVGHNIKFDLLYIWNMPSFQAWLKMGGEIWDTQYAEYTISGQENKYPKLRDIAENKYKLPKRTKWIEDMLFNKTEENKQNGYKLVSDLPQDKVLLDVMNDVKDTREIYLRQVEMSGKLGMRALLELEMDAILATTEIEYNGIYVDKQIMETNKENLQKELNTEYLNLNQIVKRYWR